MRQQRIEYVPLYVSKKDRIRTSPTRQTENHDPDESVTYTDKFTSNSALIVETHVRKACIYESTGHPCNPTNLIVGEAGNDQTW